MKKFNLHSLWLKCFVFIFLLVVLPSIIISFFSAQYNISAMVEQKRLSDQEDLTRLATAITAYTDQIVALGNVVNTDPDVIHLFSSPDDFDATEVNYIVSRYTDAFPTLVHITFITLDETFLYESQYKLGILSWFFNPTKMNEIREGDGMWTLSFNIILTENSPLERVIAYASPVVVDNEVIGYTALLIPTSAFNGFLDNVFGTTLILEGNRFFASAEGVPYFLDFTTHYMINSALFFSDTSTVLSTAYGPQIITTKSYDPLNIQFVVMSSYHEFRDSIVVSYPDVMMTTVISIIMAFIGSLILSRVIARPIVQLKKTVTQAQSGDMTIRAKVRGKDEVADLAHNFNVLLLKIQHLIQSLNEKHQEHEQIQMQLIHEQVKPHFLYNTLETINNLIRCDLKEEAIKAVSNIAAFYRISLSKGKTIVTVDKEYQLVKHYLELQSIRYVEFLDYTLAFSANIMEYYIPKLTLQPLIENAIYHGIRKKAELGHICVTGYLEDDLLVFEVLDTGNGLSKEKIAEILQIAKSNGRVNGHFGISSVTRRLKLFSNVDPILNIDSIPEEYTCIQIKFPAIRTLNPQEET